MNNQSNHFTNPLLQLIKNVAETKNLAIDDVVLCLKTTLEQTYKKHLNYVNVEVNIDFNKGLMQIEQLFDVVDDNNEDYDDFLEMPLSEAKKLNPNLEVGGVLRKPVSLKDIKGDLISKMVLLFNQKINETAFKTVMSDFINEVGQVIEARVEDIDTNKDGGLKGYIVNLETTKGYMPKRELSKGEKLDIGKKYLFVIKEIQKQSSMWPITLSRSDSRLLEFLLNSNTPEIANGTIEIKKMERSPGTKSKVAVISKDPVVDPIAAILGPKGERIRGISEEFNGEIIDIVIWNEDKLKFLVNAVLPAEVVGYNILQDDERDTSIEIVVPANQIANVFGFKGINIRLISNLTGWSSVDVYTEKDAAEQGIEYTRVNFQPQGIFGIKKRRDKISNNPRNNNQQLASDKVFYTSKANVVDDEIIVDLAKQAEAKRVKQIKQEATKPELQLQQELNLEATPKVAAPTPTPAPQPTPAPTKVEPVPPPVSVTPKPIPKVNKPKPVVKPKSVFSITVEADDSKTKPEKSSAKTNTPQTKQTFDNFDDL
ncbi:transcription termination/antitermination protein NusA [Mycoplasmoides pneumoniae]|nr:transcription termination/antitermination protein NusA [Mycoplasmoides pneumoniae]